MENGQIAMQPQNLLCPFIVFNVSATILRVFLVTKVLCYYIFVITCLSKFQSRVYLIDTVTWHS